MTWLSAFVKSIMRYSFGGEKDLRQMAKAKEHEHKDLVAMTKTMQHFRHLYQQEHTLVAELREDLSKERLKTNQQILKWLESQEPPVPPAVPLLNAHWKKISPGHYQHTELQREDLKKEGGK